MKFKSCGCGSRGKELPETLRRPKPNQVLPGSAALRREALPWSHWPVRDLGRPLPTQAPHPHTHTHPHTRTHPFIVNHGHSCTDDSDFFHKRQDSKEKDGRNVPAHSQRQRLIIQPSQAGRGKIKPVLQAGLGLPLTHKLSGKNYVPRANK